MNETLVTRNCIDSINAKHAELMVAGRTMIEKMIGLGSDLHEVRRQLPYGKWESWAEQNLKFDIRTAQRYIAAYERRHELQNNPDMDVQKFLRNINGHANVTTKKRRTASPLPKASAQITYEPEQVIQFPKPDASGQNRLKNLSRSAVSAPDLAPDCPLIDPPVTDKAPVKTAVSAAQTLKTYRVALHVIIKVERLIYADSPEQAIDKTDDIDESLPFEIGDSTDLNHVEWISDGYMRYQDSENSPEVEEYER
jgi:hypothetical protein